MNWRWLFLSFDGRLNRKPFWIGAIALMLGTAVVAAMALLVGGPLLFAAASVLPLYPWLALGAKRLQDRSKPWTWLLVLFILPSILQAVAIRVGDPFFGGLLNLVGFGIGVWAFVELGCLRGTVGPNRYGPDPLGTPALASV